LVIERWKSDIESKKMHLEIDLKTLQLFKKKKFFEKIEFEMMMIE
jgi:hypothetical protein